MKTVLAIDPGVNGHGWALFSLTGVLQVCGYSGTKLDTSYARPVRMRAAQRALSADTEDVATTLTHVFAEVPTVRDVVDQKGPQSDIMAVGVSLGMVLATIPLHADIHLLLPENWKKQMKKVVVHKRLILHMTTPEKEAMGRARVAVGDTLWHNVMDAVGIGYIGGYLKLDWRKPEGLV